MKLNRNAIIVGSDGQDGRLLAQFLKEKNYQLALVGRERLDINSLLEVKELVLDTKPKEIYYLAAHHHSAEDKWDSDDILLKKSTAVHVLGVVNFLETMVLHAPYARLFYASSSHIFPSSTGEKLSESTRPLPENIYAITKYTGMLMCQYYREKKGIFTSCGILFNHESNLRSVKYLSRKIVVAAVQIFQKQRDQLILGNLDVAVDWGYAPDYVDAMYRILQLDSASDYVVASGKTHTVRQFVDIAFNYLGLNYIKYVKVDTSVLNKNIEIRVGDAIKLRLATGWAPTVSFQEMVILMVKIELENFKLITQDYR